MSVRSLSSSEKRMLDVGFWMLVKTCAPTRQHPKSDIQHPFLKCYFRRRSRRGIRLEVGVVPLETRHRRDQVIGEQCDLSVVPLNYFIVLPALHGDAIFRSG